MMRRTFVRLDSETIKKTLLTAIVSSNSGLKKVDEAVYLFKFDDAVFAHATMLLGRNPNRLGYELGYYLKGVTYLLGAIRSPHVALDSGTSDFKRRASEDLGVGMASLFMVESFNLGWETISQIPVDKKLTKLTPDFVALSGNHRYVFEAKGTTQADHVPVSMNKAYQQAKSHVGPSAGKFAFVSYFPNNLKTFPTFMFVADPPTHGLYVMDRWHAIMLHYAKVLEYCGFRETQPLFMALLRQKARVEKEQEDVPHRFAYHKGVDRESRRFVDLQEQVGEAFVRDSVISKDIDFEGTAFLGRSQILNEDGTSAEVFFGVQRSMIESIVRLEVPAEFPESRLPKAKRRQTSLFSDGTIFDVALL